MSMIVYTASSGKIFSGTEQRAYQFSKSFTALMFLKSNPSTPPIKFLELSMVSSSCVSVVLITDLWVQSFTFPVE